jgi:hypothetical protein
MTALPLLLAASLSAQALEPGRYGMRLTAATIAELPFLGKTKGSSTSWLLVEIESTPSGLVQSHRTCAVRMGGAGGGRVEVPDAFLHHLGQPRYGLQVGQNSYVADLGPSAVGWDPALAEAVPQTVDDPGVIDWDEDGQPGATIKLRLPFFGKIDLFVAQHAHMVLTAHLPASGPVEGTVSFKAFDQRTIGGTHPRFAASPPMQPDAPASSFALAPVPADTTCGTLESRLGAILEG